MNRGETAGLVLMLVALGITILILLYDLYLARTGQQTISQGLWIKLSAWSAGTGPFPWMTLILPAGISVQSLGLLLHFFAGMFGR
jgi:hypothetical protein